MPRPTPLLGYRTPYVKGGEVVLPVLTGCGTDAELTATPAMWRRLFAAIESKLRDDVQSTAPVIRVGRVPRPLTPAQEAAVRGVVRKPNGSLL